MGTKLSIPKTLQTTPLHPLYREFGAKLISFSGYEMPIHYSSGILKEHLHTRSAVGLFDVSHMGHIKIEGEDITTAMETLVPSDLQDLREGGVRYTQLTNKNGGILDDLTISKSSDHLHLIVNAARKFSDIAHLRSKLPDKYEVKELKNSALLALQGPEAAAALAAEGLENSTTMAFMSRITGNIGGIKCIVWRSGYTGEDGYEIFCAAEEAVTLARHLLMHKSIKLIGLGARDTLRLEAGLCLYGNDIDMRTTPVEAGLLWSIGKRRREFGGFPGASIIQNQIKNGVERRRVGLKPVGRTPIRAHTQLFDPDGIYKIGTVTSGGFGPSLRSPIAMGYVKHQFTKIGTSILAEVRGNLQCVQVVKLPFIDHRYFRS